MYIVDIGFNACLEQDRSPCRQRGSQNRTEPTLSHGLCDEKDGLLHRTGGPFSREIPTGYLYL